MSFAAPAALLWLLLLFPIIIFFYLLKLKRREVVVSSVLLWAQLVKDVQANSPFQKLKRNLLLLLQLLTVLFLIVCLARPLVAVRALGGQNTIVILDASASMQSRDVGRSRFEEARAAAFRMADAVGRGDSMMVILAGTRTRVLCPFTDSRAQLRQAIGGARPEDGTADLRAAVLLAASMIRGKQAGSRAVILSDGAYGELEEISLTGDLFQFERFGRRSENAGIVAADVRKTLGGTGGWQAFVAVRNFGAQPRKLNLELSQNDNLIAIREMELPAGGEKAEIFPNLAVASGILHAHLDVRDDLAVDDDAYTQLSARQEIRVLLVTNGNLFLEKALNLDPRVRVSRVTPPAYTGQSGFDVVVFDGVSPKAVGPGSYFFVNAAGPRAPVEVTGEVVHPSVVDLQPHPVTRYVSFANTRIARGLTARPAAWARAVVESGDGPLVVVGERPDYKTVFVGFNMSYPGSDFCLKVSYPIFIGNCLDWLAARSGETEGRQIRTGDVVPLDVPATVRSLTVTDPDGGRHTLPVEGSRALFDQTARAGIYHVRGENFRRDIAASLLNVEESNTRPSDKLRFGRRTVSANAGAARSMREVWRWLALAALLLLGVEWYAYHRRI